MAGRGPAPKDPALRRRRNADTVSGATVLDDGVAHGPTLVEQTGRETWPAEVERWWETWRSSAQAKVFLSTDWQRLGMLALLVEQFYKRPGKATFEEIRLNEERLGATLVDRQRARLTVERTAVGDAPAAPVLSIVSARDGLRDRLQGSS